MDWPSVQIATSSPGLQAADLTVGLTHGGAFSSGTLSTGLPRPSVGLFVYLFHPNSGSARDHLVDIGLGASGSETPIITSLLFSCGVGALRCAQFYFPIAIPASTRISARTVSSIGSSSVSIAIAPVYGTSEYPSCSRILTVGDDVGGVGGTQITPGVSGAKGSWAVISASLATHIRGLSFALGFAGGAAWGDQQFLLDIGVHTGTTYVLIPDIVCSSESAADVVAPRTTPWLPIELSAGTPVSARMSCSAASSPNPWDIVMYGAVA